MLLLQPIKSTAGEYGHRVSGGSSENKWSGTSHENKVDLLFYYDLTRYVTHAIYDLMVEGKWPKELPLSPCGSSLTRAQIEERGRLLSLGNELSMDGFYGKYGRFHVEDFRDGVSFQDVRMRVARIDFLRGAAYDNKMSEWSWHPRHGRFVYVVSNVILFAVSCLTPRHPLLP